MTKLDDDSSYESDGQEHDQCTSYGFDGWMYPNYIVSGHYIYSKNNIYYCKGTILPEISATQTILTCTLCLAIKTMPAESFHNHVTLTFVDFIDDGTLDLSRTVLQ